LGNTSLTLGQPRDKATAIRRVCDIDREKVTEQMGKKFFPKLTGRNEILTCCKLFGLSDLSTALFYVTKIVSHVLT